MGILTRRLLMLAAVLALPLSAQQVEPSPGDTIRVEVEVVNVPVTVSDKEGRFVIDLKKEDFRVFEDGEEVEIRYFTSSMEEEAKPPLHAGFLIDLSNTARLYYKNYQESIGDLAFLLVPETGKNRGFLMGYHTEVDMLVDFTDDPYPIAKKMSDLKHGGGSAMLDAIYEACANKLESAPYLGIQEPRKVIVVVGDGHDNASKHSIEEVIDVAQRNQVTIYAVSTVAWGRHEAEEANLHKMAEATGGLVSNPLQNIHKDIAGYLSKPQDAGNYARQVGTGGYAGAQLEALYDAILAVAGNVRSQYLIGYTPRSPLSVAKYRRVRVQVNFGASAEIDVHYRNGYFPPKQIGSSQ